MRPHKLLVTANGEAVGELSFESTTGQFSFIYTAAWLKSGGFLLAPRLTPAACSEPSAAAELIAFLGNLLPEGQALDDIAAAAVLSKTNLYGLLRYLGRESAGALALIDPIASPTTTLALRRELTYRELSERINSREVLPFSIWDGKVRLSIAGLQDKIAVMKDGDQLFLVEGALASTYILKPPPRNPALAKLVVNEYFCMTLAQQVKLPVASVELIRVPEPVLLIRRFDREQPTADKVRRIHVVDGCQALGLPASYKYERNFGSGKDVQHIRDGASLSKLFSLMDYVHNKAAGKLALLRWCLFQYLIGNSDAHGKNISFFVRGGALVQAEAYDLVCVEAYPEFEQEAAMAIGDTFDYDAVGAFDWAQFAVNCTLSRLLVSREMKKMAEAVQAQCSLPVPSVAYQEDDLDYLATVVGLIRGRAEKMLVAAREVPKIDTDFL